MELTAQITINKHGVKQDERGLSPMQSSIFDSYQRGGEQNKPVIIVSAPTGSGKSFVFEKCISEKKENIIFIVPTIELSVNLRNSFIETCRNKGFSDDIINKRIHVFNSSTIKDELSYFQNKKDRSDLMYNAEYIEESDKNNLGHIVFTTPETLFFLLNNRLRFHNQGVQYTPLSFIGGAIWNRIVIDESHLLTQKMVGFFSNLIAFTCRSKNQAFRNYTQFVFLSATQVDYNNILNECGISSDYIHYIDEKIEEQNCDRYIHGDVTIKFIKKDVNDVLHYELKHNNAFLHKNKTMVILDSLRKQMSNKESIEAFLGEYGFGNDDFIYINSLMHTENKQNNRKIDNQKLFIGTSSIEQGITIKDLNNMIIEPGFESMNFIQRIGRVSRGNISGEIIVAYTEDHLKKKWFRNILQYSQSQERTGINDFIKEILKSEYSGNQNGERLIYNHNAEGAAVCSNIISYIYNQNYKSNRSYETGRFLYEVTSSKDKNVYKILERLKKNRKTKDIYLSILNEIVNFRGFREIWHVTDKNGKYYQLSKEFCMKNTRLPAYFREIIDGKTCIKLDSEVLSDIFLEEGDYGTYFEKLIGINGCIFENKINKSRTLSDYLKNIHKQLSQEYDDLDEKDIKESKSIYNDIKYLVRVGKILPVFIN